MFDRGNGHCLLAPFLCPLLRTADVGNDTRVLQLFADLLTGIALFPEFGFWVGELVSHYASIIFYRFERTDVGVNKVRLLTG